MDDDPNAKRRRVARACDICRRKKVKCDGLQPSCTNCKSYGFECTFNENAKKRGPPKGYIEGLESRLERMEELLKGLVPGVDLTEGLDLNWDDEENDENDSSKASKPQTSPSERRQPVREASESSSYDTEALSPLADDMGRLTLDANGETRYVGNSSGLYLLESVREYQAKASGQPLDENSDSGAMRGIFWRVYKGSKGALPSQAPVYPSADIVDHLIDLFFSHIYPFMPIVHRPTFLSQVQIRDNIQDPSWRCLFFNILSTVVVFSDRPDLKDQGSTFHLAARYYMDDTMNSARIVSLQALVYMCLYLQAHVAASPVWMLLGAAVRFAQELGLHRDPSRWKFSPIEAEIRKRVFWGLYISDRQAAVGLGRPFSIQDFDCDVPFPEDVDDEDITMEGIKPHHGFSKITAFCQNIKLQVIVGKILQSIYAINKARIKDGQMPSVESDQQLVTELDSALNEWHDAIPAKLRWNPNESDNATCVQAALLQTAFYANQNLIHRNFIRNPDLPEATSFPSLAICTNAARGTIHIIDSLRKRGILKECGMWVPYHLFIAASVLLITIWQNKADPSITQGSCAQVQVCVDCISELEDIYEVAARCKGIVKELAHFSDVPLYNERKATVKRPLDEVNGIGLSGIESTLGCDANGIPAQVMSPNTAVRQLLLNFPDVLTNTDSIDEALRTITNTEDVTKPKPSVPASSLLDNLALPTMATPKSQSNQLPPPGPGPAYGMGQVGGSLGLSPGPANMLNTAFWQMPASMEWDDWESYMSQIGNNGTSPNMQLGMNLPPQTQM